MSDSPPTEPEAAPSSERPWIVISLCVIAGLWLLIHAFFGRASRTDRTERRPTNLQVFGSGSELYLFFQLDTTRYQGDRSSRLNREIFLVRYDGADWQGPRLIASPDRDVLHPCFGLCRYPDQFVFLPGIGRGSSCYAFDEAKSEFRSLDSSDPIAQEWERQRTNRWSLGKQKKWVDACTHASGWQALLRDSRLCFGLGTHPEDDPDRTDARFSWNGDEYVILGSVNQRIAKIWVEPYKHDRAPAKTLIEFDMLWTPD